MDALLPRRAAPRVPPLAPLVWIATAGLLAACGDGSGGSRRAPATPSGAAAPASPATGPAPGPVAVRPAGSPEAAFDRVRHDFGVAPQGAELTTTFALTNRGAAPLHVRGVHGNCGCVVGEASAPVIASGAKAEVVVTFHTYALVGALTKWVQVTTDDPIAPITTLELAVDVSAGVLVDPANFTFPASIVGSAPTPTMVVKWREGVGRPFAVTGVDVRGVDAEVTTTPWASTPWKGWKLALRFRAPLGVGAVAGEATIHTDAPERPTIDALVGGTITGKVWLTQREVSVGVVPEGAGALLRVLVRPFDAGTDLGEVRAAAEGTRVTATAVRAATTPGAWHVEIRLPTDAAPGAVEDRILVTTAVPGEERLWIKVGGLVTPRAR